MTVGDGSDAQADESADDVLDKAEELEPVPERDRVTLSDIEIESHAFDLRLQKIVGFGAFGIMVVQLVVADAVFVVYASSKGWGKIPEGVMQVWLAATVVQVIGVVIVIARSVFPVGGR